MNKYRHPFHPDCETMEDRVVLSTVLPDVHSAAAVMSVKAAPRPSFTVTQVSATQVRLSWANVSGAKQYLVQKQALTTRGVAHWVTVAKLGNKATSYTVSNLTPGVSYIFDVVVVKGSQSRMTQRSISLLPQVSPLTHPNSSGTYEVITGTLFGPGGPAYSDVHQGGLGDCWLMASLAEAAGRAPQDIERMFTDLGNYVESGLQVHLWSVHFYSTSGSIVSVTVDNELPANSNNCLIYDQVYGGVLWAALAEKAYAQAAALNYVPMTGSFSLIDQGYYDLASGSPSWALSAITGHTTVVEPITYPIESSMAQGYLVVLATGNSTVNSMIVPNHGYAVISDTTGSFPFTIYNPWGQSQASYNGHTVYGNTFECNGAFIQQNWCNSYIAAY